MTCFKIESSFWELFPQAEIGVVLAKAINNTEAQIAPVRSQLDELLAQSNEKAKSFLAEDVFSENHVVSVWREAYRQFKTKKGARSSIEALLKRVDKGNQVGAINPLVDLYNVISLQYGLPCGGEDLDTFCGDLRLTKTDGGDCFVAIGDDKDEPTLPGEICYLDDKGAVCRCWNWRDGQRTMLTEDTTNAFLIIESVDPKRHCDLQAALQHLENLCQSYLGGTTQVQILDQTTHKMLL